MERSDVLVLSRRELGEPPGCVRAIRGQLLAYLADPLARASGGWPGWTATSRSTSVSANPTGAPADNDAAARGAAATGAICAPS